MSKELESFKYAKNLLRDVLGALACPFMDPVEYRKIAKEHLQFLLKKEFELAEEEPWQLPDEESEALKRRANSLIQESEKYKGPLKNITLSVTIPSEMANDLRVVGNTIANRAGYKKIDFISPDEAASLILQVYLSQHGHEREDFPIPFSELKKLAISRMDKSPHSLTKKQKDAAMRLYKEEALTWEEAVTRMLSNEEKHKKPVRRKAFWPSAAV